MAGKKGRIIKLKNKNKTNKKHNNSPFLEPPQLGKMANFHPGVWRIQSKLETCSYAILQKKKKYVKRNRWGLVKWNRSNPEETLISQIWDNMSTDSYDYQSEMW